MAMVTNAEWRRFPPRPWRFDLRHELLASDFLGIGPSSSRLSLLPCGFVSADDTLLQLPPSFTLVTTWLMTLMLDLTLLTTLQSKSSTRLSPSSS